MPLTKCYLVRVLILFLLISCGCLASPTFLFLQWANILIGLLQKTKNVETMEAFQKIEDSMERWSAFTCGHIKGAFTCGVKDSSIKSPNTKLAI